MRKEAEGRGRRREEEERGGRRREKEEGGRRRRISELKEDTQRPRDRAR